MALEQQYNNKKTISILCVIAALFLVVICYLVYMNGICFHLKCKLYHRKVCEMKKVIIAFG